MVRLSDSISDIAADAFSGCDSVKLLCSVSGHAESYVMQKGIPILNR